MHFCCLGSGSRGNAYVVEKRATTLMIDCGFSLTDIKRRLVKNLLSPADIDALLITHEHSDHTAGLRRFLDAYPIPAYMSRGTAKKLNYPVGWRLLQAGKTLLIGDLQVLPVAVPHNAAEPLQFIIDDGAGRLGLMTDLGHTPPALCENLKNLNALIVECNYSASQLAANKRYPMEVKRRIAGDYGHLENEAAACLLGKIKNGDMRHVVATHLSAENNTPTAARQALRQAINGAATAIHVSDQENGADWLNI